MEALADPARLELLDDLRRAGPVTAPGLAARLRSGQSALEADLRELAAHGLVTQDDERRWQAAGKGLVFEIPEDPEGQAAARRLSNTMLLVATSPALGRGRGASTGARSGTGRRAVQRPRDGQRR